jgi:hypothetical protein
MVLVFLTSEDERLLHPSQEVEEAAAGAAAALGVVDVLEECSMRIIRVNREFQFLLKLELLFLVKRKG